MNPSDDKQDNGRVIALAILSGIGIVTALVLAYQFGAKVIRVFGLFS